MLEVLPSFNSRQQIDKHASNADYEFFFGGGEAK